LGKWGNVGQPGQAAAVGQAGQAVGDGAVDVRDTCWADSLGAVGEGVACSDESLEAVQARLATATSAISRASDFMGHLRAPASCQNV